MTVEAIIQNLRNIVAEWHEATDDENLEDVKASVKMILDDVCNSLNIEPGQFHFHAYN